MRKWVRIGCYIFELFSAAVLSMSFFLMSIREKLLDSYYLKYRFQSLVMYKVVMDLLLYMGILAAIYTAVRLYVDGKLLSPVIDMKKVRGRRHTAAKERLVEKLKGYKTVPSYRLNKGILNFLILMSAAAVIYYVVYSHRVYGTQIIYSILLASLLGVGMDAALVWDGTLLAAEGKKLQMDWKNHRQTDKPIYLLFGNMDAGVSTFSRPLKLLNFRNKDLYILLNEAEARSVSTGDNKEWLYNNTQVVVYLINPLISTSMEVVEDMVEKVSFFHSIPHITQLALVIEGENGEPIWKDFYERMEKYGSIRFIPSIIDKRLCLSEHLLAVEHCQLEMQQILSDNGKEFMDAYSGLHKMPPFLYVFFKNLICGYTKTQLFFGLFDMVDMSLRLVCFANIVYNRKRITLDELNSYSLRNLNSIAKCIYEEAGNIKEHSEFADIVSSTCSEDYLSAREIAYLENYLNCEFTGGRDMTLLGAVVLVTLIRNKTKGHGRVSEESLGELLTILLKLVVAVLGFLHLDKLSVRIQDEDFYVSFDGKEINITPFVWVQGDELYFYQQVISKNILYIDYNNGEYFRPSIEEIGLERIAGRVS